MSGVPVNAGQDFTSPGPPPVIHLRRGRPRYRIGYIAEVLNYIAAKQRRHDNRPVHIALSIACQELRMSKRTWLRMVRTLEASHWLRREVRTGGQDNKGALYWLLDPPNGRHRLEYSTSPPQAPVEVYVGERSAGIDSDAPIRNLIAETVVSYSERTFSHKPLNVPETGEIRIPGTFPKSTLEVPLNRIAERSLEERTRPTDGTTAAAETAEPSTTVAGDNRTPPGQAAAANSPQSPSLTNERSTGRGVPIRYSDGTVEVVPRSGIPPEISDAMRDLTRRRY